MAIRSGDSTPAGFYVGDSSVYGIYDGDTLVHGGFSPVSMYKYGNFSITSTSFQDVTAWLADASYPGSSISGGGLYIPSPKTGATVTASIRIRNSSFSATKTCQIRLLLDGNVIGTGASDTVPTNSTLTFPLTVTSNVSVGQVVKLQVLCNSTANASVQGGTDCYVRVT